MGNRLLLKSIKLFISILIFSYSKNKTIAKKLHPNAIK